MTLLELMLAAGASAILIMALGQSSAMNSKVERQVLEKSAFFDMAGRVQQAISNSLNAQGNFSSFALASLASQTIGDLYYYSPGNPPVRGSRIQRFSGSSLTSNKNIENLRAVLTPLNLLKAGMGVILVRLDISADHVLTRSAAGGRLTSRPLKASVFTNLQVQVDTLGRNQVVGSYQHARCYWSSRPTSCSGNDCRGLCENVPGERPVAVNGTVECSGNDIVSRSISGEFEGAPDRWVGSCIRVGTDCGTWPWPWDDDCRPWASYPTWTAVRPYRVQVYCCSG